MFINIQLYKHEPVKEAVSTTAAGRVSLDEFEIGGSDVDEEDLEARLRLSNSSDDQRPKYDDEPASSISGQESRKPLV